MGRYVNGQWQASPGGWDANTMRGTWKQGQRPRPLMPMQPLPQIPRIPSFPPIRQPLMQVSPLPPFGMLTRAELAADLVGGTNPARYFGGF